MNEITSNEAAYNEPPNPNVGDYNLNWNNGHAAAYMSLMVSKYGKPSTLDTGRGGSAIWKKGRLQNTVFDRIELRDENVPHSIPYPHSDFLYAFVNYEVPPSRFLDVSSISGGLAYDPLKKELRSRGGSMEENLVALALALQIGEGQLSLMYAQANGLYKQWINECKNPAKVDQLYDLLAFNLKHQRGNPAGEGYWALANPDGAA
jgi:hypothetical protein